MKFTLLQLCTLALATLFIQSAQAQKVEAPTGSTAILAEGESLEPLWEQGEFTEGVAVRSDGTVFFSDIAFSPDGLGRILTFSPQTKKVAVFCADSKKSNIYSKLCIHPRCSENVFQSFQAFTVLAAVAAVAHTAVIPVEIETPNTNGSSRQGRTLGLLTVGAEALGEGLSTAGAAAVTAATTAAAVKPLILLGLGKCEYTFYDKFSFAACTTEGIS